MANKVTLKMNQVRETKGTFFFEEEPKDGKKIMRSCYIEKWVIKSHFNSQVPKQITITIEDK
jgi:hypothetical protein